MCRQPNRDQLRIKLFLSFWLQQFCHHHGCACRLIQLQQLELQYGELHRYHNCRNFRESQLH